MTLKAPSRVTVPTCIGCGAMSQFGTCASGCSEHRLELVRAPAHDRLTELERGARQSIATLQPLADGMASEAVGAGPSETGYRALQQSAREALRSTPAAVSQSDGADAPAEVAVTWWCAECGGIEAPQPCLGICVWRTVEWVGRGAYECTRARTLRVLEHEHRLRGLVARLAWVTPRRGEWERSWRAFQAEAEALSRGNG